jgi:XRE family transcriptional regulator, regulator of sulfur utilization
VNSPLAFINFMIGVIEHIYKWKKVVKHSSKRIYSYLLLKRGEGMSGFSIEVGNRIRHYRKAADLTQEKLGELLSIDPSYIGRIERGEANITLETVLKVAEALQISPYDLFRPSKKQKNSEKNELVEKVTIMIMNLHIDDLKIVTRIVREAINLIKK